MAKSYPILYLADPRDRDADLLLLGMVDEADLDSLRSEIAHELAALIGVNREAVAHLVVIEPRNSISLPVPSAFVLAPHARKALAVDVAKALRFALGAQAVAA